MLHSSITCHWLFCKFHILFLQILKCFSLVNKLKYGMLELI